MEINVGKYLKENTDYDKEKYDFQFPDITLDTDKIKKKYTPDCAICGRRQIL